MEVFNQQKEESRLSFEKLTNENNELGNILLNNQATINNYNIENSSFKTIVKNLKVEIDDWKERCQLRVDVQTMKELYKRLSEVNCNWRSSEHRD